MMIHHRTWVGIWDLDDQDHGDLNVVEEEEEVVVDDVDDQIIPISMPILLVITVRVRIYCLEVMHHEERESLMRLVDWTVRKWMVPTLRTCGGISHFEGEECMIIPMRGEEEVVEVVIEVDLVDDGKRFKDDNQGDNEEMQTMEMMQMNRKWMDRVMRRNR